MAGRKDEHILRKLGAVSAEVSGDAEEKAMKVDSYKCDVCDIQRKQANHWFRAYRLIAGGVVIIPWDRKPTTEDVLDVEVHLCGAECATQWLSKNLL